MTYYMSGHIIYCRRIRIDHLIFISIWSSFSIIGIVIWFSDHFNNILRGGTYKKKNNIYEEFKDNKIFENEEK